MSVKLGESSQYYRPGHAQVAGAAADTNIAIAGIKTTDRIVSVIEHEGSATYAAPIDRTLTTSITSDGNIQCTASTAGNQLIVRWQSLD